MSKQRTCHAQGVCLLCGARWLFLCGSDRSPGDTTERRCVDCGFVATAMVTIVHDPDWYELEDPYGAGDVGPGSTVVKEGLVDA